ncbi:uncharacterized protein NECHADRAFT_75316 [Fusarium vanettenii 77-13-4]|uniref:Uncharacterized protein n=1 Tax=Fusarium vanettenii (strain ATCC MYA-4622 / CBS 123669 / FGSC 9596 / NRRL 45880 / 77-13-4) TaxID=660122 RepID=C7YIG7_FUSV7|nr:uncharacterized protein NECHADRAFT_75316 [Fusarium vanettenii 77-13-4]EEU48801.1 hypothetical protein NECHADRAFT_75316 [Fusarium vanettenii 77-13-4]
MSNNKMRPEDLPMWLPLREGCEWDSIFNMHECFDPEYDTLPLALLRLAFWAFAVSPRFLWWLLMLYHFQRLINASRTVVLLQSVTAAALYLIPWIWQSDYSRLRSQTEPFFADCWQLWLLLSSPNILFSAYHLPGTIRDGIVLARDYAYRCMDLEILFPEPGEVNLDADPRDTDGEAFFKKLLAEDRERRRRRESEEQATRENELAMREQEREVREREAVRQKDLEERRRDEAARQNQQRRGYDPDAAWAGLAAIFRRSDRRWRPRVPEPEPELELARVKVQDPRSKGSRKVTAFYSRGTQTEPRDLPGERASGEATSSRYTSNGVQTDSMTEEKQHKAPASKPQEKAASSPARDPQPSRPTPTPAPESPMVKPPTDEEPSERPEPPVSASPRPSAPRSSASRQHVSSPSTRTLFETRVSTNLQGRRPRSHVKATRRLGRSRPGGLSDSPAPAGGRVDETPSKSSESSTREGEQVLEQATAAVADPIPPVQDAPDTTSSSFKRPEDFDDFEEWFNSSPPPSDFNAADLSFLPVAPATTTTTTNQDLSGLQDDNDDSMALGDLLGSVLGEMSLRDSAEVRSTSDLMDLDQDPEESTIGQDQLASEMEIVSGDDSGDAGPLPILSSEMDWEGEESSDILMGDVEALPEPPMALTPSTTSAATTTAWVTGPETSHPQPAFSPLTSPATVPDVAQSDLQPEETDQSQDELDELERDLIAAFEENDDSSDPETVIHISPPDQPQEASQAEMAKRHILKPRSRRTKDTITTAPTPKPSSQPQQDTAASTTAANEPAHIPASQIGSLSLPGGNITTNTPTPTPSPRQQQDTAASPAVIQQETVPAIQMGGLNLPGGNITTNTPTPTPSPRQQQDTAASSPTPKGPPRKGSILSETLMTESPEEMTPIQTPVRRDSTPAGTPKDLQEAELQRTLRRIQARKGKKPQLFHSKKSTPTK